METDLMVGLSIRCPPTISLQFLLGVVQKSSETRKVVSRLHLLENREDRCFMAFWGSLKKFNLLLVLYGWFYSVRSQNESSVLQNASFLIPFANSEPQVRKELPSIGMSFSVLRWITTISLPCNFHIEVIQLVSVSRFVSLYYFYVWLP